MSANIEDLLNSDDSDDEVCSEALGEIDLEQLLERDDDEDDCASPTTALIAQLKNRPLAGVDTHTLTQSVSASLYLPRTLSLPAAAPTVPSFDPQVTALLEAERSPAEEEDAHSLEALLAEEALSPATANKNNANNTTAPSLSLKQADSTPSSSSSSSVVKTTSLPLPFSLPLSLSLSGSLALPLALGGSAASASSEVPSTPPVMTDCPSLRLAEQREMRALQTMPSQSSSAQADKGVAALPLRRHSLASSASASLSTSSSAVLDECAAISGQFLKNAQYAQHGPGTASAICASHKFVAVGTTKGCVLVFDAQQELRRVLSSPAPCAPCAPIPNAAPSLTQSSSDPSTTQSPSCSNALTESQTSESQKTETQAPSLSQVVTPMCVTSLDTLPDGSLLLSTHLCGDVVFWDTVRGTALKQVRDPSMSFSLSLSAAATLAHANNALLRAALLPGLGFANLRLNHSLADSDSFVCITQNMRGTLNRVRLSRSLLSSWHCEVDCLISEEDHSHRTHTTGGEEKPAKKPSKGSLRTFSVLRPLSESLVPETLPRYLPRPVSDKAGEETLKEREYSDLRNYPHTLQVVALSFERETHVVQLSPDVKTLFRWPLSPNTQPQTQTQTETKTVADAQPQPQREVCVDWTWHPLSVSPSVSLANARSGTEEDLDSESESETEADNGNDSNTESKERKRDTERERAADPGVWSPLLTRVCGRTIETLAVRPMFGGYSTASINNTNSNSNSNNVSNSASSTNNASTPASDPTLTGAAPATSTRRSSLFALASQSLSVFAASVSDATQHTTPSLSSTVTGASSALTFDFQACQSVTLSPSFFGAEDETLLRAQWLHATQLVALTQRSVLVLDASLSVIECASLSVPLARSLSLPPLHAHNTPQCTYTHVAQHWADLRAQSVVVSRPQRELLLLSSLSLHRATPRSPFERAETLIRSGKWLEGLALVIDTLARCPLLLHSEKPRLEMYIVNYANLAVKRDTHRPAALSSTLSSSKSAATNGNLAASTSSNKTHFSLVASVCVEYCVATRQLRLLFHELYELFRREGAQAALLEALEPSILTGDMRVLPRRVVREFLSLSLSQRRLRSVERSLVRLDPLSLQVSFVAAFCAQHALYAPLLYVYAHACNDFAAAAQLVLQDLLLCEESSDPTPSPSPVKSSAQSQKALSLSLSLSPATEQLTDGVYKLLLFLLFTFQGRVYPRGEPFPPHNTHTQHTVLSHNTQSARTLTDAPAQAMQRVSSLLRFVCAETLSPLPALPHTHTQSASTPQTQRPQPSERALSHFPALRVLCRVDAPATVYAVCEGLNALCTLLEKEREKERHAPSQRSRERDSVVWSEGEREPTNETEKEKEKETDQDDATSVTLSAKKRFSLERQLVHCLHDLLSFCRHSDDAHGSTPRSHNASASNTSSLSLETLLFQQTHASLLVRLCVRVPLDLLDSLCRYCTAQPPQQRLHLERVLQRVAQRQARFHTPSALRRLFIERDFHFAALALLSEQYCGESTSTDVSGITPVGLNVTDAQTELRRALRHYIELAVVLERDRERDRDRERVPGWDLVFEFALSLSRTLSPSQSFDAQTQTQLSQLSTDSPLSPLATHTQTLSPSAQALLDGLKEAVLRETLSLCRVDVPCTAALALSLSLSLPAVVAQCATDGRTQYLLCTQLLRDLSSNARKGDSAGKETTNSGVSALHSSAAEALDVHTLTQYVRLLCVHDPEGVRPFLVTFQSFCALDDCLQAVRSAGLADAAAFLLERSGDSLGALSALLQDVCVRVRQARREIDSQLRSEARDALSAHSHSATPSHGHSQSQNNARVPLSQLLNRHSSQHTLTEALLRLPGCRALKRLTDCLSELCERQQQSHAQLFSHTLSESPQSAPTQESPAQDIWFKAFDHLLNERHMLKSGTISASSELLAQFLSALIQQFIVAMKNGIAPQQIMLRVVTHAAGANIRLGEFKDVMCSMLELSRNELAQNVCVRGIFTQDLVHFKKKKLERMRGFVYRSSDHQAPVAVFPPQSSSSEDSPQRASSEVFLEALRGGRVKRHGVLSNRSWKLMDVNSIGKRALDKKTGSLPITHVPISVADYGLTEPEIRRPGRVDVSRAVFAENNASSWQ